MGTICELFRPKNYCLASIKEIKVICFVERSKKGMWDKNKTSEWATVDWCTSIDSMSKSVGIQQHDTLGSRSLERVKANRTPPFYCGLQVHTGEN